MNTHMLFMKLRRKPVVYFQVSIYQIIYVPALHSSINSTSCRNILIKSRRLLRALICIYTYIYISGDPLAKTEKSSKQKMEEASNFPLLLSVRSGAAVSMVLLDIIYLE